MLVSNSLPFKSLDWCGMGHTAAHWHKLVMMGPTGLNFNGRDKEDMEVMEVMEVMEDCPLLLQP